MQTPKVVIVGAGFGGIAAAIELTRAGFDDVTILEKAGEAGGTWFHNTYPGAACDVPSHAYSFSFAQRRDWQRLCPEQPDVLRYLHEVARAHDVERLIRFGSHVTECSWDGGWTVRTAQGDVHEADALLIATGQLHQPATPRLPGTFEGHRFHSAGWDHGYDLRGKRVAVVGTGASAVQFVPEIAEQAAKLTVFQRTGNWFLPRRNRPYPNAYRTLIARGPLVQRARRLFWFCVLELLTASIRHPRTLGRIPAALSYVFMRRQLRGHPELRRKVWPDYTFGCKRVLFSSFFLSTLVREDVELVTERIVGLRPQGVETADGRVHEVDCVIYGTGFRTTDFMFPMAIRGADGRRLEDVWAAGAHAHLGMTVPGFPSMFVMYGPNTNTSGGSIIFYLEVQAAYIRQALELMRDRGAALSVRAEVEAASDRELQSRFAGTAWTSCDSWYRDESGRIVTNWPGYMREYLRRTERLDPAEFELVR